MVIVTIRSNPLTRPRSLATLVRLFQGKLYDSVYLSIITVSSFKRMYDKKIRYAAMGGWAVSGRQRGENKILSQCISSSRASAMRDDGTDRSIRLFMIVSTDL